MCTMYLLCQIYINLNIKLFGVLGCFIRKDMYIYIYIYIFFFHWHYSPLWALARRAVPFHFSLSITNSLHLLTPSTWRSLSASSFHPFLGLSLRLVPSSSWVKIFLGILSSSILSRWPNQLILCPFINLCIYIMFKILYVLFALEWHTQKVGIVWMLGANVESIKINNKQRKKGKSI